MGKFDEAKTKNPMPLVASKYTELTGRKGKERSGPCPFCGGKDRFYVYENFAVCNPGAGHCGFKGDQIDLVAKIEGISLSEAANILSLGLESPRTPSQTPALLPEETTSSTRPGWRDSTWQSDAEEELRVAESNLPGSQGKEYLSSRGISLLTAVKFRLGFRPRVFNRPAICIPHLNRTGEITSIKYRFIDELAIRDKSKRFSARAGSEQLIFGSNLLSESPWRIVIVEGEFNALAISTAMSYSADVISIGSQGNQQGLTMARDLCDLHPKVPVLIWLDERSEASKALCSLPGAKAFCSPYGMDANDILMQNGILGLTELISRICPLERRRY